MLKSLSFLFLYKAIQLNSLKNVNPSFRMSATGIIMSILHPLGNTKPMGIKFQIKNKSEKNIFVSVGYIRSGSQMKRILFMSIKAKGKIKTRMIENTTSGLALQTSQGTY